MFLLDSLMISGIQWAIKTVITAAEAEMNDDSVLREQLLEAEMRREMGEISDEEFGELEADLLARIREIKERREGAGPLAMSGAQPMETFEDSHFQVEASVSGDFHDPADTPHTTVIEHTPAEGNIVQTQSDQAISVLDPPPERPARRQATSRRPAASRKRTTPARTKAPARRRLRRP